MLTHNPCLEINYDYTFLPPPNPEFSVRKGGEMNQALYAHMNNKRKRKKKIDE
jgi:hypothetical protein